MCYSTIKIKYIIVSKNIYLCAIGKYKVIQALFKGHKMYFSDD